MVLSQVAKWWTAAVSVKYVYESLVNVGYGIMGCEEFRRGVQNSDSFILSIKLMCFKEIAVFCD